MYFDAHRKDEEHQGKVLPRPEPRGGVGVALLCVRPFKPLDI